jgi:hypothetical protein
MAEANTTKASPSSAQRQPYNSGEALGPQILKVMMRTHPSEGGAIEVVGDGSSGFMTRESDYFNGKLKYEVVHDVGAKCQVHWVRDPVVAAKDLGAVLGNSSIAVGSVPVKISGFRVMLPGPNYDVAYGIAESLAEQSMAWTWGIRGKDRRYSIIMSGSGEVSVNPQNRFEVSGTMSGYCRPGEEIVKQGREGNVLIGLESGGVHCSAIAYLLDAFEKRNFAMDRLFDKEVTLGEELAKPTRSYLMPIKRLMGHISWKVGSVNGVIKGMAHVHARDWRSGESGLLNLVDLVGAQNNLEVFVKRSHSLAPQEIFRFVHTELGVSAKDMIMFNNGIGYVMCIEKPYADLVIGHLRGSGIKADVIGEIRRGKKRLVMESPYDQNSYVYYKTG